MQRSPRRYGAILTKIVFEDRAVAFIDVLGFSRLVESSVSDPSELARLEGLVEVLSAAVPLLNLHVSSELDKLLIPKHLYVSDCIVLSAPLEVQDSKHRDYDGLAAVVLRCIQLTHMLFNQGFLIRGGVSVGAAWHDATNIVGVAYQNAFKTGEQTGHPRIALDEAASDRWRKSALANTRLCIEHDGVFMVNGLHHWYAPKAKADEAFEEIFKGYAKTASSNERACNNTRASSKWSWFSSYIESEQKRI
jgi:hypothetical protein